MTFILAMVLATQVSRLSPLFLSRLEISKKMDAWLSHVPIAILTALVVPEFFKLGPSRLEAQWLELGAALLCLGVGFKSKNLLLTTFLGILTVAAVRYFL